MTEATQRWEVGRARVTSVVESQTDGIPPAFFFPEADEALILRHPWVAPRYADERGRIGLRVQAFVVEVGGRLIVVDPCVGNDKARALPFWNMQSWPFMERFRAAGFDPDDVELVLHTHLHVDHVGWDTHLDEGRWVPTFPRARHLYVGAELAAQEAEAGTDADAGQVRADSIEPILDAGLADLVEADADLGDGCGSPPPSATRPGTWPCGSTAAASGPCWSPATRSTTRCSARSWGWPSPATGTRPRPGTPAAGCWPRPPTPARWSSAPTSPRRPAGGSRPTARRGGSPRWPPRCEHPGPGRVRAR
jgi:hypothetical protein